MPAPPLFGLPQPLLSAFNGARRNRRRPPRAAAGAPAQASGLETAVLAGGCFWGVQAVFQHTKGVTNAVSGYAGGARTDADYRSVSAGSTAHAEAVQVTFDPRQISYGQILQIYFSVAHDPTQLNRRARIPARNIARRFSRRATRNLKPRKTIHRAARPGACLQEADS